MKKHIIKHLEYNTCVIKSDDKGIISFCRWNIKDDTAHVLDLIIREDERGKCLLLDTIRAGLTLFPYLKYIEFEKGYDDGLQNKELKKYNIQSFIPKEIQNEDAQM